MPSCKPQNPGPAAARARGGTGIGSLESVRGMVGPRGLRGRQVDALDEAIQRDRRPTGARTRD